MPVGEPGGAGRHGAGLTWAVGADGRMTHVSEAANGLGCACVCPICRGPLIARQGKVREHHFAHASGDECPHAVETALHLAAKDILAARKEIVLPAFEIPWLSTGKRLELEPERRYRIDSVAVEPKLGSIIPDLILGIGGRELLVEVIVTHSTDREKLRKIRDLGVSCVEIDLSRTERGLARDELEKIVVDGAGQKRWLHNVRKRELLKRKLSGAVLLPSLHGPPPPEGHFWNARVYGCPVARKKIWEKGPYALLDYDCVRCRHALVPPLKDGVLCDGFRALGKPIPPQTVFHRLPPELFGRPEDKDPMRAVERWLHEQTRVARGR